MDLLHWLAAALLTFLCLGQAGCAVMALRVAYRKAEAQEASAEALGTVADCLLAQEEERARRVMAASLTVLCSRCGLMMSLCHCKPET